MLFMAKDWLTTHCPLGNFKHLYPILIGPPKFHRQTPVISMSALCFGLITKQLPMDL